MIATRMDSSTERTPTRKKNKRKDTQQQQQENFTHFILKIATTNQADLPTQRDYFFANKSTLTKHSLLIGQPVTLTPLNKPQTCHFICQPWPVETINRNCVALSQTNLELMGAEEGESVKVEKIEFGISKATFVRMKYLTEVTENVDDATCVYLATQLSGKYVCNGSKFKVFNTCDDVILEATEVRGRKDTSVTEQISQMSLSDNSSIPEDDSLDTSDRVLTSTPSRCENVNIEIYRISNKTVIKIEQGVKEYVTEEKLQIPEIQLEELAGVERQVREIQDIIDVTLATDVAGRNFRKSMPCGVLVCGMPGVGKTTFLKGLAGYYSKGGKVKYLKMENYTTGEGLTKDLITTPETGLILLDDIDSINPHKDYVTGTNSLVGSICVLMDRVREEGGGLVATCRMKEEVDVNLRRHGRFDKEIELPAPKSEDRTRILQTILELTPHSVSVSEVSEVAWRAHGFVAGDLRKLVREATLCLVRRQKQKQSLEELKLEYRDLIEGLKQVRPSALRDVILEVPKVKWNDIGGMEEIIQRIKETVEWPLKHPEAFARLGINPPKGILLYGPPGCSKTMIARAIATESGLNFLAVKGPEIFSKWVGDSEKAVRDIFTKARMASPSVIFFDEIDALAVEREGQGSRVSDRVLTQLLTEMDGLEMLEGVTVVAATNRPDLMDKALIRPGRMDRHIYIPIPDSVTRREIFRIKLSKMSCEKNLDLDLLVEKSVGFSGAEIVNVCEEAAMKCLRENINNDTIRMQHLEMAVKSVLPQISNEMKESYENFNKTTIFRKV